MKKIENKQVTSIIKQRSTFLSTSFLYNN